MSKGKRDARQAARELAAKQRRAEQRRKRMIAAGSAVGVVVRWSPSASVDLAATPAEGRVRQD